MLKTKLFETNQKKTEHYLQWLRQGREKTEERKKEKPEAKLERSHNNKELDRGHEFEKKQKDTSGLKNKALEKGKGNGDI